MTIAFITATPLQIIIALSIKNQYKDKDKEKIDILIIGYFHDANNVCERLKKNFSQEINFKYFHKYFEAIKYAGHIRYDELFIHWDVGFRTNLYIYKLLSKSPKTVISVFEEGIGTYRDDIYSNPQKKLFKFLNLPVNIGGHPKTKKLYIYSPLEYKKNVTKPTIEIQEIFATVDVTIDKYLEEFESVFDPDDFLINLINRTEKECLIYMSSWDFNISMLDSLVKKDVVKILKLHPHIVKAPKILSEDFFVSPNSLPAEILIKTASKYFEKVTVIHNGSSVTRYVTAENILYRLAI